MTTPPPPPPPPHPHTPRPPLPHPLPLYPRSRPQLPPPLPPPPCVTHPWGHRSAPTPNFSHNTTQHNTTTSRCPPNPARHHRSPQPLLGPHLPPLLPMDTPT